MEKTKKLYYKPKKCLACRTCELVCAVAHSAKKDLFEAVQKDILSLPAVKVYFAEDKNFPVACRQCREHPCVSACIAGALGCDEKKAVVTYDKDKCVSCWMCIMVCPYGALKPQRQKSKVSRCDLCIETGEPECAKSCPVKAIIYVEEI